MNDPRPRHNLPYRGKQSLLPGSETVLSIGNQSFLAALFSSTLTLEIEESHGSAQVAWIDMPAAKAQTIFGDSEKTPCPPPLLMMLFESIPELPVIKQRVGLSRCQCSLAAVGVTDKTTPCPR
jgi:hypothetical protein